jgi:hypothetical protein
VQRKARSDLRAHRRLFLELPKIELKRRGPARPEVGDVGQRSSGDNLTARDGIGLKYYCTEAPAKRALASLNPAACDILHNLST